MISSLLNQASQLLSTRSDTPKLDAELLLMHVLTVPRSYLYSHPEQELTTKQAAQFFKLIDARSEGMPIAYLIGKKEFWSLNLSVNSSTLIPRPETELLITTALALLQNKTNATIADLGTGSGAIALAIASEKPNWQIYASDNSKAALATAQENAHDLQLTNIKFVLGNWLQALPNLTFDAIISNPPYISPQEWPDYAANLRYEPKSALLADNNGLAALQTIITYADKYLKKGGFLLLEHGYQQAAAVSACFIQAGFANVTTVQDLQGQDRATYGQWNNLR
jgi:release factor glutamine methyltransferase